MNHVLILFMHHLELLFLYIFVLTCSLPLGLVFIFIYFISFLSYLLLFSIMSSKIRANRKSSSSSVPIFYSERFLCEKNQEAYEKLNLHRKVWVECKVILDELDGKIRRNFDRRGWLPLLDVDHLPPVTLIREFYSNLSVHSYDSNTLVRSWIQDDEYTITPSIVADGLGVPLVQHPVYPYDESPPLDDIMSFVTGTSI